MAWLKTKKVKGCICGKTPQLMVARTDRNQAFAVMLSIFIPALPVLVILSLADGTLSEDWGDIKGWIVLSAYIIGVIAYVYFFLALRKGGHSLRCAARQAFFRVS